MTRVLRRSRGKIHSASRECMSRQTAGYWFMEASTRSKGVPRSGLVRLLNSGAVDGTFNPPSFTNYNAGTEVRVVAQDTKGQLIVGGFFHRADGSVANNILRLNTDGTRDAAFDGTAAGMSGFNVSALAVRPSDGKVFAGGYFSTFGGAVRNNMAWLGSDGLVATTFEGMLGATESNPQIYAIALQPDGKILAGGFFSSFQGLPHYNLVRLNSDGTIDPSFNSTFQTEGSRPSHTAPGRRENFDCWKRQPSTESPVAASLGYSPMGLSTPHSMPAAWGPRGLSARSHSTLTVMSLLAGVSLPSTATEGVLSQNSIRTEIWTRRSFPAKALVPRCRPWFWTRRQTVS